LKSFNNQAHIYHIKPLKTNAPETFNHTIISTLMILTVLNLKLILGKDDKHRKDGII